MMRFTLAFVVALAGSLPARADVNIQEVTTPGGITAWLVEDHTIPFTALELRFRGGASLDLPGKRGATYLMTGLLEEGAGDLDARAFAREMEGLAAGFNYNVYDDALTVSAKFLTENRDQAVDLLRSTLIDPTFAPDDIERVRAQVASILRSNLTDPDDIASAAFDTRTYGDHPYATQKEGTLDSLAGLTREDLVTAKANAMALDRIYVGVVGDISAEELGPMLDHLLGDLPATGAPMPERADPMFDGGTHVVPFDTPQSVALFGQKGISQDDPDFFAAYLLNVILGGGGFESRLMHEVREKRGLTYGVYSYLVGKDQADVWMGSVSSANDRIADAIKVIRDEWTRMAQDGATEEELAAAKKYLTGAYPLRFDGNGPIANIIVGMQMQGMPIDYAATRNDRINAVTLDDVNRVAKELLDPDALTFVVTGQPERLTETSN
ncbi:insulinase family protein [Pseudooceanicola sp. 216_PA32_1]|uniref:Insulinase family protein n=1 Tax=Pseudooceanicola pacificus TaxID=2676438 RepID=A0A844W1X3_9RHOB|nr:pitrilysin family protein [Pseudooceanicola pacificus]MWB76811.1 insulinase family protein [Pseudooceanicola pacificus]